MKTTNDARTASQSTRNDNTDNYDENDLTGLIVRVDPRKNLSAGLSFRIVCIFFDFQFAPLEGELGPGKDGTVQRCFA